MIALHLRDSPPHLVTASQEDGLGLPATFGGSSFHMSWSPVLNQHVTNNLRDLYRVRCYSIDVNYNKYIEVQCQQDL